MLYLILFFDVFPQCEKFTSSFTHRSSLLIQRRKNSNISFSIFSLSHAHFRATTRSNNAWSTLVEGGKERFRPPGKLTLELVLANQKQNKL